MNKIKKANLIYKSVACAVLILVMTMAIAFSALNINAAAQGIIAWGATPNSQERTPEVPKGGAELLKENNGIFVADTTEKKVFFTFDLGYEAGYTSQVLDILKEHDIKAIFFLCGNYLKERELVTRMLEEGHAIGNHTDHHKDLPTIGEDAAKKDITDLNIKLKEQYGDIDVKYFRPPQGRFDEQTLKLANSKNLKTVMWSIAIVDWGKKEMDANASSDKILSRIHPGAIVLSHITNVGTPKMLAKLIPAIKDKGYVIGNSNDL